MSRSATMLVITCSRPRESNAWVSWLISPRSIGCGTTTCGSASEIRSVVGAVPVSPIFDAVVVAPSHPAVAAVRVAEVVVADAAGRAPGAALLAPREGDLEVAVDRVGGEAVQVAVAARARAVRARVRAGAVGEAAEERPRARRAVVVPQQRLAAVVRRAVAPRQQHPAVDHLELRIRVGDRRVRRAGQRVARGLEQLRGPLDTLRPVGHARDAARVPDRVLRASGTRRGYARRTGVTAIAIVLCESSPNRS